MLPASEGGRHPLPHWAASVVCLPHISAPPGCREITLGGDPSVEQPILWEIEDSDLLQVGYAGTLTFEVSPVLPPVSHFGWVPAHQPS